MKETISFIESNGKGRRGITNQFLRFFTNIYIDILVQTTNEEKMAEDLYMASNNESCLRIVRLLNIP